MVIIIAVSPDDLDPRIRTRIIDESRCTIFPIIAHPIAAGRS
jgi:hypothetical protein